MSQPVLARRAHVVALAAVGLLLTACGPSTATTQPAPSLATTQPAPSTATSQPAPASAPPPTAPGTPLSQPAALPASAVTLTIDPAASRASYHAREQLVGKSLTSDAVGTSQAVAGSLILGAAGAIDTDQSRVTVDLSRLQSDESRRDNFIKNNTLQTSRYPTAIFVPRQAQGLPTPLPIAGQATFQLSGDLTVHGITRPVTWEVTAQFGDANVSGRATTTVNITDFGMTPPRVGPVLSIEDGLTLELAFSAARDA